MIIGEAPGSNEEQQGIPFIGKAGKMLRETWLKFLGLNPDKDCYITNVMKCAPREALGMRIGKPTEHQAMVCSQWLDYEIAMVKPKLIITLGSYALQAVSNQKSVMACCNKTFNVVTQFKGGYPDIIGFSLLHPMYFMYKKDHDKTMELALGLQTLKDLLIQEKLI
jgi:DNA polymerase